MPTEETAPRAVRLTGLILGPIGAGIAYAALRKAVGHEQAAVAALLVLMATWWLTLAVDMAVTALLPALLIPLLGVGTFRQAAAPYADEVIFLFGAGFVLSRALERYGLSIRFAKGLLRAAGTRASLVVGALMLATACISAFVPNTATAAAMLPIALSLGNAVCGNDERARRRVLAAAVLGVAYASSIGGGLTMLGSPPNMIAVEFVRKSSGSDPSFASWLAYGLPIVALLLPLAWFVLVRVTFPIGGVTLEAPASDARRALPAGASRVLVIFCLTVSAWLSRPLWSAHVPGLSDALIAVAAAVLLFTVPRNVHPYSPLVEWREITDLPWGVLILFGGGLSLAEAITSNGVTTSLATAMAPLGSLPIVLVVAAIVTVTCFASEMASNTALAAASMPLVGAIAETTGAPVAPLAIAAALGASMAFMLPVGTPPNAIALSTGHVRRGEMARAGIILNLASVLAITAVCTIALSYAAR
jgi:sodium-dependent dicarboxylate transporter 2/3/5